MTPGIETDIADGPIGEVGKYDIEFKKGKLRAEVQANIPIGSAGVVVELDAGAIMDAIAKAIPGTVDDAIISVMKAALLGK